MYLKLLSSAQECVAQIVIHLSFSSYQELCSVLFYIYLKKKTLALYSLYVTAEINSSLKRGNLTETEPSTVLVSQESPPLF